MLRRSKIGIVVDTLGRYNTPALRFAILKLNVLQTIAEFEIVYDIPHQSPFVIAASSGRTLSRPVITSMANEFLNVLTDMRTVREYRDVRAYFPCDRYMALCNVRLQDNYYLITTSPNLRLLAVGEWSNNFSPPSLLEFIIHNCIKQAVRQSFGNPDSHLSARACLFDFNDNLENTRNGVLIGHICSDCEAILSTQGDERWKEVRNLVGGRWLGDPSDPFSTYSELKRLGFRAFQASGVEDSWLQRIYNAAQGHFVEEIIKYLVMGLALYVAIRFGLSDLSDAIQ